MLKLLSSMAFVGVILLLHSAWAQAPAVDPQSLVGEWQGEWKWSRNPAAVNGRYYLTIHKVNSDKVYGKVEFSGGPFRPPYDVEGKLEGNILKYSSLDKQVSAELVITGNTMTGLSVRVGVAGSFDITATKRK